jgi:hypothetical protein
MNCIQNYNLCRRIISDFQVGAMKMLKNDVAYSEL